MAVDFREIGWDVKRFFKQLVMSVDLPPIGDDDRRRNWPKDPAESIALAGRASRMDAEMVRDYALAASGLLVNEIGGPSVKPYQPKACGKRWR